MGPDEVIPLLQSAARRAGPADPATAAACILGQRPRAGLGEQSGVGVPAARSGSHAGLSQCECYCKVSAPGRPPCSSLCAARLCGSAPPCTAAPARPRSECRTFFLGFSRLPPTAPASPPAALSTCSAASSTSSLLTQGPCLGEGRAGLHPAPSPSRGRPVEPHTLLLGRGPRQGRCPWLRLPWASVGEPADPQLPWDPRARSSPDRGGPRGPERGQEPLASLPPSGWCAPSVGVCDSAFSLWMGPLLRRPSRNHGAGRHGDSKGRMEVLPAALCVSGFAAPSVRFAARPSSPSAPSPEQRAGQSEGTRWGVRCAEGRKAGSHSASCAR